ncbi:relaxase/mobilization nuclease domain-containing protein [Daejeonella oryzae]|uniref:relaxase/mobilization nuclease domain-containing protein n=1 Tax=Daejeonella oryzae TaxID=1122943 RepID=UPI00047A8839|nr:relaxase/mobilization nuclease domain-containing protein [Daejeonella oryzae]
MVAKISSGKSIRGILKYNENKVNLGEARLIMASGFAMDINKMSFENKARRYERLTMLNGRVKTNAMHISLNFANEDKLSDEKLQQIGAAYMNKIGFGDQPYLIYKHLDAGHPHLHIATVIIKPDGKRIDIHGIGRTISQSARKELELEYKLVLADGRTSSNRLGIKGADIEKAIYGKVHTKRAITNIVNDVIRTYKFTSLTEFNAILKQFNVVADRGKEDTIMFHKKGLIYSVLDKKGDQIGIPIKSSSIYGKPTLANLQLQFEMNKELRKPYRDDLKERIDQVLGKYSEITRTTFQAELQKQKIHSVFRQNNQGYIFGLTFIDNKNKTIFNGSDLGKNYSAKVIMKRFGNIDNPIKPTVKVYLTEQKNTSYLEHQNSLKQYLKLPEETGYLKSLLNHSDQDSSPQGMNFKKKKKKKRSGISI